MRGWRVGSLTLGLVLIGFGALLISGHIQGLSVIDLIYMWWPAVLIMLGIETLAFIHFAKARETKVKFDGISIFLIILIILFTIGGYGLKSIFNNSSFSLNSTNIPENYKHETRSNKQIKIPANGSKKLILSNSMGKIDVSCSTADYIEIEANITIKNNDEETAKKLFEKAVEISMSSEIRVSTVRYNYDDIIKNISIDYAVKVPSGIEVDIKNSYGDIFVRDISSNVNIENSNGRITAGLIEGNLEIRNSFGTVEVNGTNGNVNANNSNGDIFIKNTNGNVDVNNSFGAIEVQEAEGDVKAAGSNGRIYIENPSGNVYAHNSLGEIYVINPYKSINLESGKGLIKLETSKLIENSVQIKNSFGGIILNILKSQSGKMQISTSFGDINSNMNLNINKDFSKASVNQILGDGKVVFNVSTSNGNIEINSK